RSLPYGLYVVGARRGEDRNGMTLNWASQLAFEPKLVGIGVEQSAYTHELISEGGVFSLCTIARDDRAIVRKFTKPVEVDLAASTMNGFAFRDGVSGAPILEIAVAYVDCELRQAVPLGQHTLFVGEVIDAGFQRDEDTELLRMEDTRMDYGG
ncbi:MAG: flavin reductase family protein, partial [Acidimicrobiia bacterium]|nr:flavin reductase family protein [Acidimicrobiia bacterium]